MYRFLSPVVRNKCLGFLCTLGLERCVKGLPGGQQPPPNNAPIRKIPLQLSTLLCFPHLSIYPSKHKKGQSKLIPSFLGPYELFCKELLSLYLLAWATEGSSGPRPCRPQLCQTDRAYSVYLLIGLNRPPEYNFCTPINLYVANWGHVLYKICSVSVNYNCTRALFNVCLLKNWHRDWSHSQVFRYFLTKMPAPPCPILPCLPKLPNCCACISLKTGTLIIGALNLVFCVILCLVSFGCMSGSQDRVSATI